MIEVWKDICGYEGSYKVSNLGRVKSLNRSIVKSDGIVANLKSKILSQNTDFNGYKLVVLSVKNKARTCKVHRLAAISFIGYKCSKMHVNHINGVKDDNTINNLEWCTPKENMKHAFDNKLIDMSKYRSNRAKLSWSDVMCIRKSNMQQKQLALMFNVDPKAIRQILNYKTYKNEV